MTTEPSQDPAQTESIPEIQVDSDWKAEAQAEKERLSEAEQKVEEKAEARQMPEPNFHGLMSVLTSQALMGLGMHQDPSGKGVMVDLEGSKFAIDLLGMLEEKTAGNLSETELAELKQLLQELQSRFVQIAQLVASQMNEGGTGASEPATPAAGGIIDPTSQ